MTYRSADTAIQGRIEGLEAEITAFDREIAERAGKLAALTSRATELRSRLEREGPGGGTAGARILRIPLLTTTFLGIGAVLLPFQFYLAGYLSRPHNRDALPCFLIACGPTVVGTFIATSYRNADRLRFFVALGLTALVASLFLLGRVGVIVE